MRILFAGTPEIAVPSLEAVNDRFDICGVLTSPDKAAGRGRKQEMSPVKTRALELGIPVLQPEKLDSAAREAVLSYRPDILTVVAYGKIFGPRFLGLFPMGGINLHPSLLPRYRGPSPIPAAILNGDAATGITVQVLAEEMDAGDILVSEKLALTGTETTGSLTLAAARSGSSLMVETLERLMDGTAVRIPQNDAEATYCGLIRKEDGIIDWNEDVHLIERKIRAYTPWPGAVTRFKGEGLTILSASVYGEGGSGSAAPGEVTGLDNREGFLVQTGNGILAVRELRLQARKALDWKAFRNGVRDFIGSVLGGSSA